MLNVNISYRIALAVCLATAGTTLARAEPTLPKAEPTLSPDWAASPAVLDGLLAYPSYATWDDAGNILVAEEAAWVSDGSEANGERTFSIKRLQDQDGDGVFETVKSFADSVSRPGGLVWVADALYLLAPDGLWRLADEDGDGQAEQHTLLPTGFVYSGPSSDLRGPFLHPNGRLYWTHGPGEYALIDEETGDAWEKGRGSRLWSCQLSGGEADIVAGGGIEVPMALDFTETGDGLGIVQTEGTAPEVGPRSSLRHWVHGGIHGSSVAPDQLDGLRRSGLPLADLATLPADSGSAVSAKWIESRLFRENSKPGILVTHATPARVTFSHLVPKGAGFVSEAAETLFQLPASDGRLGSVLEDLNGEILVIDSGSSTHRGGIFRLTSADRVAPEKLSYPAWSSLSSEQVALLLDSPSPELRKRAVTELAIRGESALPELHRIVSSTEVSETARLDAIWALARMKFSESTDLIFSALTDLSPKVQQAAAEAVAATRTWQIIAANQPAERAIELERNRTISGALAALVANGEAPVARAAATALGRMGEVRAIPVLLSRLRHAGDDRDLEHALVYGLVEIDDYEATRRLLSDEPADLSPAELWALHEMSNSQIGFLEVRPSLDAVDPARRAAAVAIVRLHPEWDAALANHFYEWGDSINAEQAQLIGELIDVFGKTQPVLSYVEHLLKAPAEETQDHARQIAEQLGIGF